MSKSEEFLSKKVVSIKRQRQFVHRLRGEIKRRTDAQGEGYSVLKADLEGQLESLEGIDKNLEFLEGLAAFLIP